MTSPRIDASTLAAWRAEDPDLRILDVRTPAEFEGVHIPGAYNVPVDLLDEHRHELTHLDEKLVLVCRSGQRATMACQKLAEVGLPNLYVLDGGIDSWERAGGEVKRGAEKWSLERQVRLVAGAALAVSILLSIAWPAARFVAGFVGAGLVFAAVSNTCMMGLLLAKLPYNRSSNVDVDEMVQRLARSTARR